MNADKKELVSAYTHLGGAVFGVVATIILLINALNTQSKAMLLTFLVFGMSIILLYSTSTIYHFIDKSKKKAKLILRKLDHIMIFVLISGTYTPICALVLNNSIGYKLLAIVWSITLIGVFLKIFWITAPNWVSSVLYIAMGWMSLSVVSPLVKTMPLGGTIWLFLGGVFYTVGGVIYGIKMPNISKKYFGFHELFHIFVLAGTFCHFIMVNNYVIG